MPDKQFLSAEDIANITGRKPSFCYKLIRQLNEELAAKGFLVVRGRVPTGYFMERLMLTSGESQ